MAAIHINFLSLYFFHNRITKRKFSEVFYVPLIMFPYIFILAYIVTEISLFIRENVLSNELFFLSVFFVYGL